MKSLDIDYTERGFEILEFDDRYGKRCSLQKSSLATEDAIWFGPNDADPIIMDPSQGRDPITNSPWHPVPFPEGTSFTTRMHLTQDMVKELLPYLIRFAETGQLGERK